MDEKLRPYSLAEHQLQERLNSLSASIQGQRERGQDWVFIDLGYHSPVYFEDKKRREQTVVTVPNNPLLKAIVGDESLPIYQGEYPNDHGPVDVIVHRTIFPGIDLVVRRGSNRNGKFLRFTLVDEEGVRRFLPDFDPCAESSSDLVPAYINAEMGVNPR